jgi:hypothetical protein
MYLLFIHRRFAEHGGAGDLATTKVPTLPDDAVASRGAMRRYIGEQVKSFLDKDGQIDDLMRRRDQIDLHVTAIDLTSMKPLGFALTLTSDRYGVIEYKKGNEWVKTEGFSVKYDTKQIDAPAPDTFEYGKMPLPPEYHIPDWREVLSLPRFVEAL